MSEFCAGNCAGCPNVVQGLAEIEGQELFDAAVTTSAMSETLDDMAPQLYEVLAGETGYLPGLDGEAISTPEELAAAFRQNAGDMSERLNADIDSKKEDLQRQVMGCVGPLTMRAVKAGVEVTVKVCMSPQPTSDEEPTESAIVKRRMVGRE